MKISCKSEISYYFNLIEYWLKSLHEDTIYKRPADAMNSVSELNPPWHSKKMKTLYHEHSL